MRRSAQDELLLDLIYNAAVDSSLWVSVLQELVLATGGEGGVLTRLNVKSGIGSAIPANGDAATLDKYFGYYYSVNPLLLVSDTASYVSDWKPRVLLDDQQMPREALERSEYYNDFLRPISSEWGISIRLGLQGFDLTTISIGRPYNKGRFEQESFEAAVRVQPHLIRACALSQKVAPLKGLASGLTAALDSSSSAVFIVDSEARMLYASRSGEQILVKGNVLHGVRGRLGAANPCSAQLFAAVIKQASTNDWERRRAGSLVLQPKGQGLPLSVTVAPLRLEVASVFTHGPAVLVCLGEQNSGVTSPELALSALYGLTTAESRLAVALAEGVSLHQASLRFSTSINTVRTQLRSIFAKVGVNRQAELIRILVGTGITKPI